MSRRLNLYVDVWASSVRCLGWGRGIGVNGSTVGTFVRRVCFRIYLTDPWADNKIAKEQ